MKLFFEEVRKEPGTVMILTKAESDAMVAIIGDYLKTKPNKRSAAFKLATRIDEEFLV
jgi:hypothetical protein